MLLEGKRALVLGVANNKSIAYGIAKEFKENGAKLAFNFLGDALKKRVEPICEELDGDFIFQCDVSSDEEIAAAVKLVEEKWGGVDIIVHSIGFADRKDLQGRFIETSRDGFKLAMDISAYSLTAVCGAFEHLLSDNASIITMSYYGSEKVITNYNVMGVAKAALEASVRYLAADLGTKNVRINAISAGPIKTLAASGIGGFRKILNYIEENAPMQRNVTTQDVGKSALYLASDLSAGVTGEVLHVDCGYHTVGIGIRNEEKN